MTRTPWIMRLPPGLRDQPAFVFIGMLVGLGGLSFVSGLTQSTIVEAVGPTGIRIWGAILTLSGFGVVYATISARHALEKLTLRVLSICMLVYIGWLFAVVDWRRAVWSAILGVLISGICEIRIAVLKALYRLVQNWRKS